MPANDPFFWEKRNTKKGEIYIKTTENESDLLESGGSKSSMLINYINI